MGSCVVPQGLGPRPNEPGTIPLTTIFVRGSNEKNMSIKGKKVTKENDFKQIKMIGKKMYNTVHVIYLKIQISDQGTYTEVVF